LPPEDAQFLQSRQWQTLEVARWFGVPPHLVGEVTKSTTWGTGLEEQNTGLLKYTLQPYLTRFEQRVTREICPVGAFAEFLVDSLLRPDTLARYSGYNLAIMAGWMTRNEARRKENLQPLDGLDEPLVPTLAPPATGPAAPIGTEPDSDAADGDEVDPLTEG
jgi:HK97 family phage portal protein